MSSTPKVDAIVFDLDDTLVDTYKSLIEPLEYEAASQMVAAGIGESDVQRVADLILQLRIDSPEKLEEKLLQELPLATERALEARRAVFNNASPDKLSIEPEVKRMLEELANRHYDMYLLTTGPEEFQRKKVEQLEIGSLFREVKVLKSGSEITKEIWLRSLVEKREYDKASVLVVGNRLDNEIQAGNKLGMITVWVKRGEGSGLSPCEETGQPDHIISDVKQFPEILAKIESSRALEVDLEV